MERYFSKVLFLRFFSFFFVFAVIVFLMVYRLTFYNFPIFDEYYYVEAAIDLFRGKSDPNFVHPPFAKWLISLPMYYFGDSWSFSWRVMPVLFGLGGVLVVFFFSRCSGLSWFQSLLVMCMLVGTQSWLTLSRTGMLDIFLSFFVLCSGFMLFLYFKSNQFSLSINTYSRSAYFYVSAILLGLAGACKLSGFFPLMFLLFMLFFFIRGSLRQRVSLFFLYSSISVIVYSFVFLALLRFDFGEFGLRHLQAFIFHNSAMLPENSGQTEVPGGWLAVLRFFFFYDQFIITPPYYPPYGLANNFFLPISFLLLGFLLFLFTLGYVIRAVQRISGDFLPALLTDKVFLFVYLYGASLILTWFLIPRVQYNFYYVPAFPFLIIAVVWALYRYAPRFLRIVFLVAYFVFFLFHFSYILPLS